MTHFARTTAAFAILTAGALLTHCSDEAASPVSPSAVGTPQSGSTASTELTPSGPLSVSVEWEVVPSLGIVAGNNQESYKFTAIITGGVEPYAVRWNFGDGSGLVEGNPVTHKYYSPGTYHVIVIVKDAAGTTVRSDGDGDLEIEITPSPFGLKCYVTPTDGDAPLEVSVRAEPDGNVGPIKWSWDFGDGEASDSRIASHVYDPANDGGGRKWFTAMATATDGLGRSVQCGQVIAVTLPKKCTRVAVSQCVGAQREDFWIGADGCRDDSRYTNVYAAPLRPNYARARINNDSGHTQTVQFSWAGGDTSTHSVAPGDRIGELMRCGPAFPSDHGPITITW